MGKWNQRLSMEICIAIILFLTVKKIKAINYSCDETKKTVVIVDGCPNSAEKWREAAANKNCSANANQCTEPGKFVYHCVINAFVNQTLELCAYAQNIVSGYCTEYNERGNLIQSSIGTSCKTFNVKPCPTFYRSNEAYKYTGCYELVKPSTTIAVQTKSTTTQVTHIQTSTGKTRSIAIAGKASSNVSNRHGDIPENDDVMESPSGLLFPGIIIFSTFMIITACVLVIVTCKKNHTACFGKLKLNDDVDEEGAVIPSEGVPLTDKADADEIEMGDSVNLSIENLHLVQMETKEEKKVLVPSGQILEKGDGTSALFKVEEDDIPDISINEKEKEEQECQRLFGIINGVLERIAILQHESSREVVQTIGDHYNDPLFLANERNEKIREECKVLESIEEYFKKEHTVTRE